MRESRVSSFLVRPCSSRRRVYIEKGSRYFFLHHALPNSDAINAIKAARDWKAHLLPDESQPRMQIYISVGIFAPNNTHPNDHDC